MKKTHLEELKDRLNISLMNKLETDLVKYWIKLYREAILKDGKNLLMKVPYKPREIRINRINWNNAILKFLEIIKKGVDK